MQNTARVEVEEKRLVVCANNETKEMTYDEWLKDGEPLPQGFRSWNMAYWFWYEGRDVGFAAKKFKQVMNLVD